MVWKMKDGEMRDGRAEQKHSNLVTGESLDTYTGKIFY